MARRKLKKWFRSIEPRVLAALDRPGLVWAKPWLDRHDLLAFTRRPLAMGVAIGLFCGLIPGPGKTIAALLCCSWFRGNAVAAVAATCYTNPLTIIPIYMAAFKLGDYLLPGKRSMPAFPDVSLTGSAWMSDMGDWVLAMGWPLLTGLVVMGLWLAMNGYWLVNYLWLRPVFARAKRIQNRSRI